MITVFMYVLCGVVGFCVGSVCVVSEVESYV